MTKTIDTLAELIQFSRQPSRDPVGMSQLLARRIIEDYVETIAALPETLLPDESYNLSHAVKQLVDHNTKLADEMNSPMGPTEIARAMGKLSPDEECVQAVTDLFLRSARNELDEQAAYRSSIRVVRAHVDSEIARANARSIG